ncbi:hypothetical protein GCM10018954_061310 [Kutzneria kofuensis]
MQAAVDAVKAAASSHVFPGITDDGLAAIFSTAGNPDCHVILRGSSAGPNYDRASVEHTVDRLAKSGLPERVIVDASHGNSGKDHLRQPLVAADIATRVAGGETDVVGIMLESFLEPGRQETGAGPRRGPGLRAECDRCVHGLGCDRVRAALPRRRCQPAKGFAVGRGCFVDFLDRDGLAVRRRSRRLRRSRGPSPQSSMSAAEGSVTAKLNVGDRAVRRCKARVRRPSRPPVQKWIATAKQLAVEELDFDGWQLVVEKLDFDGPPVRREAGLRRCGGPSAKRSTSANWRPVARIAGRGDLAGRRHERSLRHLRPA